MAAFPGAGERSAGRLARPDASPGLRRGREVGILRFLLELPRNGGKRRCSMRPGQQKVRYNRVIQQLRALPNQLTLLRLSIIPFLALAILDDHYHRALILLVIAGLSDGLDGFLARLFRQRTQLGAYLDPIADKLLLSTLFLVLMHKHLVPLRITVLVFSRDLGILIVAAMLYNIAGMRDFSPSIFGKANTLAQIVAVTTVIVLQTYTSPWLVWLRHFSLQATLWLTLISGFHYLWLSGWRLGHPAETRALM